MNIATKYIFSLALAFNISSAHAADPIAVASCETTPSVWEIKSPPKINNNNNLRRKTGSPEVAQGDFITIEGRVLDSNCVPVPNAVVEIWHANSEGVDQNDVNIHHGIDPNFLGSGKAITDNLGYYRFLTIFPGTIDEGRAPHINFRIRHRDFMPTETEMFFENQMNNGKDQNLVEQVRWSKRHLLIAEGNKINPANSEEGIKYGFNIVLEGTSRYKTY